MVRDAIPVSLDPPPIGRSVGDMSEHERKLSWTQSPDQYLGTIIRFRATYRMNGRAYEVAPNDFVLSIPGSRCDFERHGDPPFEYVTFNFNFGAGSGDEAWIPIRKAVPDADFWYRMFMRSARRISVSSGMFRAVVPAFLWSIAEFSAPPSRNVYVAEAERIIDERLGQTIRISALADEIGISQSQLNRHFLQETGATPMQFILDKRAELAHRLLTGSSQSIKDIARSCGFPDTHAFSRFVRDRIGASPRSVRARTYITR